MDFTFLFKGLNIVTDYGLLVSGIITQSMMVTAGTLEILELNSQIQTLQRTQHIQLPDMSESA